ncbi:hypothetical protein Hanom_Chr10g00909981 [Helianthus anomalus]
MHHLTLRKIVASNNLVYLAFAFNTVSTFVQFETSVALEKIIKSIQYSRCLIFIKWIN